MLSLGIDTSNYSSSAALAQDGELVEDIRRPLNVKRGERGLRQSDALYQHWENLPAMLMPVLQKYRGSIGRVAVSSRPRPVDGSYMPVFNAGVSTGRLIASSLGAEYIECSHQEGHIMAASLGNAVDFASPFLCAHLSGGTLETVLVSGAGNGLSKAEISVMACTSDISYGQLLDRLGVALGYDFPAGEALDKLALKRLKENGGLVASTNPFCRLCVKDGKLNLSGLETQLLGKVGSMPKDELAMYAMQRIAESFKYLIEDAKIRSGASQVLVSGGVAASVFLRTACENSGYMFGKAELCGDNAVGVAIYK